MAGASAAAAASWAFSQYLRGADLPHGLAAIALLALAWMSLPVTWWSLTGFPYEEVVEAASRTLALAPFVILAVVLLAGCRESRVGWATDPRGT